METNTTDYMRRGRGVERLQLISILLFSFEWKMFLDIECLHHRTVFQSDVTGRPEMGPPWVDLIFSFSILFFVFFHQTIKKPLTLVAKLFRTNRWRVSDGEIVFSGFFGKQWKFETISRKSSYAVSIWFSEVSPIYD